MNPSKFHGSKVDEDPQDFIDEVYNMYRHVDKGDGYFPLMTHAQQIKDENLKERAKESKRANASNGDFSHSRSSGKGRSQFLQKFFG
ncbi:hypothetical protein MTR67_013011 [Solanum verrucosum]|uniref:Gag-pol polyprotein n=1 Tax=Solanum verrucosum TaxID=315347 RepID=A0AAF0THI8_SOLVR|nr:hypothetical protein MTR67_013011 [Solanum verrucosum]